MLKNLPSRILYRLFREMESMNRRYSLHGDAPFFDPHRFSWTAQVAARTADIRAELDTLLPNVGSLANFQDISPDQAFLTTDAGWKTFFFAGYGVESQRNRQRCPRTAAAIDLIPGVSTAFLPWLPRWINGAMMALIRRTRFVQVAAKNQKAWETSFYG